MPAGDAWWLQTVALMTMVPILQMTPRTAGVEGTQGHVRPSSPRVGRHRPARPGTRGAAARTQKGRTREGRRAERLPAAHRKVGDAQAEDARDEHRQQRLRVHEALEDGLRAAPPPGAALAGQQVARREEREREDVVVVHEPQLESLTARARGGGETRRQPSLPARAAPGQSADGGADAPSVTTFLTTTMSTTMATRYTAPQKYEVSVMPPRSTNT